MWDTVGEIVVWVVLAGVAGLACGWLLRSVGRGDGRGDAERRITRARDEALAAREEGRRAIERTADLEEELAGLRGRAEMQATLLAQRDGRIRELEQALAEGRPLDESPAREPGSPPSPPREGALATQGERTDAAEREIEPESEARDEPRPATAAAVEPAGTVSSDEGAAEQPVEELPALPVSPAPPARGLLVPEPPPGVLGPASAAAAAGGDRRRGEPVIPLEDEDDLRHIRGVGPVIEGKLRLLGVTTYRQIAAWTDRDVEDVSKALGSFPDRIRRDGWVASARDLHRRKYGVDP